jgi:hypothetical protein
MKSILGSSADPTAEDLAQNAERRVATLKSSLRSHVAGQVRIIAAMSNLSEETVFAQSTALGNAALAICEIAGAAEMAPLGEAARGIYILMEAQKSQGVWHTDALRLHINALMMFDKDPDISTATAEGILAELKTLRDWIGVQD